MWMWLMSRQSMQNLSRLLAKKLVKFCEHAITTKLGEDDFTVYTQEDILSVAGTITNVLTVFLGGIAAISLLVGGIGIMNIMLVSVTERTKEIGLRKAVGARKMDILIQFLTESSLLSLIGGIIGIIFGWLDLICGWTYCNSQWNTFHTKCKPECHPARNNFFNGGGAILRHLSRKPGC